MVWAIQNIISLNNPKLPLHPRFKIPNLKNLNNSKIFTSYDSHRQSKLPNRLHLNAKWSSHRECKIYHHYIIWKNQFHKQKVHVLRLKLLKSLSISSTAVLKWWARYYLVKWCLNITQLCEIPIAVIETCIQRSKNNYSLQKIDLEEQEYEEIEIKVNS